MDNIFKTEFYGDNVRWFRGVIEDINDPLELGRVRVRVSGLHSAQQSDISTADLPWASVILPTTENGISGLGSPPQLQVGAQVFGIFMDGKTSQIPAIIGSMPRIELPTDVQLEDNGNIYGDNHRRYQAYQGRSVTIGGLIDTTELGLTNAEIAFNFFLIAEFTPEQSAGIVGNLMQESGAKLDTSVEATGRERSYGIAQWNRRSERFDDLKEYAKEMSKPWTDLDIQLNFIIYELNKHRYLGLSQLKSARTIEEATRVFQNLYERPRIKHERRRINYAKDIYNRMTMGEE